MGFSWCLIWCVPVVVLLGFCDWVWCLILDCCLVMLNCCFKLCLLLYLCLLFLDWLGFALLWFCWKDWFAWFIVGVGICVSFALFLFECMFACLRGGLFILWFWGLLVWMVVSFAHCFGFVLFCWVLPYDIAWLFRVSDCFRIDVYLLDGGVV